LTSVLCFWFSFAFSSPTAYAEVVHGYRRSPSQQVLADIERQAEEGLRGGLLEKTWARRALALVREVRMLRERLSAIEDQEG
jgi:hypothetical protein